MIGERGLLVLSRRCSTCIFHSGNRMHLHAGRVASMVADCRRTQGFIPCHETMRPLDGQEDEDDPRMDGPICRGFYDAHGEVSQLVRIFGRLDAIQEVDPP